MIILFINFNHYSILFINLIYSIFLCLNLIVTILSFFFIPDLFLFSLSFYSILLFGFDAISNSYRFANLFLHRINFLNYFYLKFNYDGYFLLNFNKAALT